MRWSLLVARIDGTDIKVHWSFVLVIPYFLNVTQPEGLGGLLFALFVLLLLFVCVALHELGHSFVAGRLGIPTRHIVLWPLGGFAVLSRQPERPLHQVAIFGAGPLVNLLVAGGLFLVARGLAPLLAGARGGWPAGLPALLYLRATLRILVNANIALALFNLIPAYPLDGGRVVRALLVALAGERRADVVMLVVSWLFAGALAVYGALGGDWLLVVLAALVFFVAGLLSSRFADLVNRVVAYARRHKPKGGRRTFLL